MVVSFGYFVPSDIIHGLKKGAVNVHPSLLPKYRGAAPIQHTILGGDDKTGVTVQELDDKKFDAGRILAQETLVNRGGGKKDEQEERVCERRERISERINNVSK